MHVKQHTIKKPITVSGVGLHTGNKVNMTFNPAPEGHGCKFQRIDLPDQPIVEADVDNVTDTSRGTTIEKNGAAIHTVEHTLAALAGLQIDNVLITMDAPEPPIMDGSSIMFIEALEKAGLQEQAAEREYFEIPHNILYNESDREVEMVALPFDGMRMTVMVDYNSPVLGSQHATISDIDEFKKEIASCRTFCFLHELEMLLANNLIKGGDLNNAIVIVDRVVKDDELEHLAKLFNKKKVEVKKEGILNNVDLRYQNEPARHKLLDLIGDLALVGVPLKGHIMAARPGHKANVAFARKIKALYKKQKNIKPIPKYDPNVPPIFDINDITRLLPHRSPFLLVDKVIELTSTHVVGVKNVTMNEPFFQGHFPGNPVMPGVLQIEAMAQTGGILVLSNVPDPENYTTLFMKIEHARFKEKVVPGDTILFRCELVAPIRRGICQMRAVAYVGNKVVAEAELMAQVAKTKSRMNQPLSYVHPDAKIASNVVIEPFVTIHKDVEIGEGTWIGSNVTIMEGARIGKNVNIFPGAVISAVPQDLKFDGERSLAIIGDNTTLREYVTINRGTKDRQQTKVGNNCLLMAYVHVAHDCIIGDNCILANAVNLAGHITVDDNAIIGGLSAVHQFVHIGAHAMISGGSLVRKDVPPFVKAGREPLSYAGVNSVGLRRRGYTPEQINSIQDIYRIMYLSGFNNSQALSKIEAELPITDERDEIINFIRESNRGIMKGYFI